MYYICSSIWKGVARKTVNANSYSPFTTLHTSPMGRSDVPNSAYDPSPIPFCFSNT